MLRVLFNLGNRSSGRRAAQGIPVKPSPLSRRDFLTFRRGARRVRGAWRVMIDAGLCTDCRACTRICHEAALRHVEEESFVAYSFDAGRCDGCGDCRTVCAANALNVLRGAEGGQGIVEIASLSKQCCSCCRESQTGLRNGVCPACRQTERLRAIR